DVSFQGRCSRWSRALRGRYSNAERKRRARQPREPREQAPRFSAPPGRLPALFPQFALLPQSGPRLILCTCEWAHTSSPDTILSSLSLGESTFLTINLPATAGKVAGCEWGVSHLPVLKGFAFFAAGCRVSDAVLLCLHPGFFAPLPKSAARWMLAPTFSPPVYRPAPLPSPKDVPLQ
uniref:Uncharacterized protein n=1 Tax=Nomascus leucogenys TaxID=61853 RepID=A0A2I3FX47_NOMLE